jgi:hypothetical protein
MCHPDLFTYTMDLSRDVHFLLTYGTQLVFYYLCFHPEIALFRNLCACPVKCGAYFSGVNLRNHLCGVQLVRLRGIP